MFTEEEVRARIQELSEDYELDESKINEYYELLTEYPFFSPDEEGIYCLELVCQSRANVSEEFKAEDKPKKEYRHTVEYSINDAIYSTYEEASIPYLSDSYRENKGIIKYGRKVYSYDNY